MQASSLNSFAGFVSKLITPLFQAALERQKAAKLKRLKNSLTDRIKDKLAEELELIESEYQAQRSLEVLIQERSELSKQLATVKV